MLLRSPPPTRVHPGWPLCQPLPFLGKRQLLSPRRHSLLLQPLHWQSLLSLAFRSSPTAVPFLNCSALLCAGRAGLSSRRGSQTGSLGFTDASSRHSKLSWGLAKSGGAGRWQWRLSGGCFHQSMLPRSLPQCGLFAAWLGSREAWRLLRTTGFRHTNSFSERWPIASAG